MSTKLRLVTLNIFFIVFLQGCVSVPIPQERPSQFQPDKGFVAIRVITNTSSVNTQYGFSVNQWKNLTVTHSDGMAHTLPADNQGVRNSTQVFAGLLPPGRYRLKSLETAAPLESIADEFEVKNGQITSLGALIYQPTGNHGFTLLRVPDASLVDLLASRYPTLVQQAQGKDVVQWLVPTVASPTSNTLQQQSVTVISDPVTSIVGTITVGVLQAIADRVSATSAVEAWQAVKDPAVRLSMSKASTYSYNNIQDLPTGEIIAGSNLGQLLVRDPNSGWTQRDTGRTQELTAVYAADRSRMIVGGEEGLLLSTQDGGSHWTQIKTPLNTGLVLGISRYKQSWLLMSVHEGSLVVNVSNDPVPSTWREIMREFVTASPEWPYQPNWHYAAVISGDRYIVSTPLATLRILNLSTMTWAAVATPKKLRALRHAGNQLLYGSNFFVPPQRSGDQGNTWQEVDTGCSKTIDMSFANAETGYLLCFSTGAFVGSTRLYKTINGGSQWDLIVPETPVMSITLHASTDGKKLFYSDVNGTVYFSHDGGANWVIERPVFLRTIVAATN